MGYGAGSEGSEWPAQRVVQGGGLGGKAEQSGKKSGKNRLQAGAYSYGPPVAVFTNAFTGLEGARSSGGVGGYPFDFRGAAL